VVDSDGGLNLSTGMKAIRDVVECQWDSRDLPQA